MRRHFSLSLASVTWDNVVRIHGQQFVRVDRHAEQARVRVDEEEFVTLAQVVYDRSFGQIRQIRHVFSKLIFRGILRLDVLFLDFLFVPFKI